jgi:hypothetical protein
VDVRKKIDPDDLDRTGLAEAADKKNTRSRR